MKEIVVLLTSCVNPTKMINTTLSDPNIRIGQYINALMWYLENTPYDIYYVDNSNVDIKQYLDEITLEKYHDRLTTYHFKGNEYFEKGKGAGELEIIEYFIKHSSISKQTLVVKISGRIIIRNLQTIIKCSNNKMQICIHNIKMKRQRLINSRLIIAPVEYYEKITSKINNINETAHVYFETICFNEFLNWIKMGRPAKIALFPLNVIGVSGTTGKNLVSPSIKTKISIYVYGIINNISIRYFKRIII